jgi:cob(I)alamin adenosyltransferase
MKGITQVYTGNGKGKTTASLGLALRAAGHGLRVCMVQFLKRNPKCGEHLFAERTKAFEIFQFGAPPIPDGKIYVPIKRKSAQARESARRAFAFLEEIIRKGEYNLIILDEVNLALDYGFVKIDEVVELIENKPENLELVLTGRRAPKEIIEVADLITEMVEIKHPYKDGLGARRGIEY